MPAGGGVPLEDIGVGDARTLRGEAAAAEAEGRFGYGADVGTGAPRKGALEFVDVRKYAAGFDGDGDGEDGNATGGRQERRPRRLGPVLPRHHVPGQYRARPGG